MLASPDSELVERFRSGRADAFDALFSRHRRRVFDLACRMTGDSDWAEDITVDIFLEAYLSLPRFRFQARFSTWLHRIAVNVCLEHIRRRKAQARLAQESADNCEHPSAVDPSDIAMSRELAERITAALQALPDVHRVTIMMFYLEQRTCAEIARMLNIPRGTVKTRIFYGTRMLRDRLTAEGILSDGG